jgi:hypothetical protein
MQAAGERDCSQVQAGERLLLAQLTPAPDKVPLFARHGSGKLAPQALPAKITRMSLTPVTRGAPAAWSLPPDPTDPRSRQAQRALLGVWVL